MGETLPVSFLTLLSVCITGGTGGDSYGDILNTDLAFGSGGAGATTSYGAGIPAFFIILQQSK